MGDPKRFLNMQYSQTKANFEGLLSSLQDGNANTICSTMCRFYESTRIDGCDIEADGDMLLFQYGLASDEQSFYIDITRQMTVDIGEEDDCMYQLHVTAEYSLTPDIQAIGGGCEWCYEPSKLEEFKDYLSKNQAMIRLGDSPYWSLKVRLDEL